MVKLAQSWRVPPALGNQASGWGLCYPVQRTLGELAGNIDQADVSCAQGFVSARSRARSFGQGPQA